MLYCTLNELSLCELLGITRKVSCVIEVYYKNLYFGYELRSNLFA
jgi:hypothetical protein